LHVGRRLLRCGDDNAEEQSPRVTFLLVALLAALPILARKMPEPLIGESVTDIDSTEAGELEGDATGVIRRPGGLWTTELEIEWRALSRLGVSLEGTAAREVTGTTATELRPALAFVLLHDQARDFHLMIDATARLFENDSEPGLGEPALPVAFSLRGGIRRRWLTLRGALGASAGGHSAHVVPLRAEAAALVEVPFGFWGVEGMADLARSSPWMLAPEVVLGTGAVQIGAALPWEPGTGRFGALVRLIFEVDTN
jgi:hypothetical protein